MKKWFDIWWWRYIFAKRDKWYSDGGCFEFIRIIICRLKNHPCGVIWFNPNGLEPDMHCKNCGDEL